jgi:hypothetical protein
LPVQPPADNLPSLKAEDDDEHTTVILRLDFDVGEHPNTTTTITTTPFSGSPQPSPSP